MRGDGGHCYAMTYVLSYSAAKLSSIYTIGPIVNDGLQCAGHQFDAGANNLKDGWACLAVVASDTLGNKQVSRPIRICVTVNAPASTSCPDFKPVTAVVLSDPVEIDTSVPLVGPGGAALQANDEVVVSAVLGVSGINQRWKVTPLDASGMRFSLQGAHPNRGDFGFGQRSGRAGCGNARLHWHGHQRGNRRWTSGGRLHQAVQTVADIPTG